MESTPATDVLSKETPKHGKRRAPGERRKEFVEKAIIFFSEVGFEGGTRELAKRLGVTQPLIYRYFPSKDDLIREVYESVYISRWEDQWTIDLTNRDRPVRDRLIAFYDSYTKVIFTREWMRIFFFAGLKGLDINKWYVGRVRERVLIPACRELHHAFGISPDAEITDEEIDLAWTMHGGIFYHGIRKHIYMLDGGLGETLQVETAIDMFFDGLEKFYARRKLKQD